MSYTIDSTEKELMGKIAELQKDLEAYRLLKAKYPSMFSAVNLLPEKNTVQMVMDKQKDAPSIPDAFDAVVLTWTQKCLFALKALGGSAFADEVIDYLSSLEPLINIATIKNSVTNKLSKMNKAGWIKTLPSNAGRKFKYALNEYQ